MNRLFKLIFSIALLVVTTSCLFICSHNNVYAMSSFNSSSNLFPLVNSSRPLPYYLDNNTPRVESPYTSKYAPVQTLNLYSSSFDNRDSMFNYGRVPNSYHVGGRIISNQNVGFSVYFPLWYILNDDLEYRFIYGWSTESIQPSHSFNDVRTYFDIGFLNENTLDFGSFYSASFYYYDLDSGSGMMPYVPTSIGKIPFPENYQDKFYQIYARLSITCTLSVSDTTSYSYFSPVLFYDFSNSGNIVTEDDYYSSYAYYSNCVNDLTNYLITYDTVYESSYEVGYNTGFALASSSTPGAFQQGYDQGFNNGYNQGNSEGYNTGFNEGDTQGYNRGITQGQQIGYNNGYQVGYQEGLNTEGVDNMLGNAMITVVELPWKMIKQILNFEVLGINFASLFLGLFTLVIVFWLLRHFS